MLVVLDTNVLFQALHSSSGASFFILQLIREQKVKIALSMKVFAEYEEVLKRPKSVKLMGLDPVEIDAVLTFLAFIGRPFVSHFLFRPNLMDEDDNIFVELVLTSSSKYLITSNIRDLTIKADLKIFGYEVITPTNFVKKWRMENEN